MGVLTVCIKTAHTYTHMNIRGSNWLLGFSLYRWMMSLIPSSAPVRCSHRHFPSNCFCLAIATNHCSSPGSGICISEWPTKHYLAYTTDLFTNASIWTHARVFHNLLGFLFTLWLIYKNDPTMWNEFNANVCNLVKHWMCLLCCSSLCPYLQWHGL